jgi:hypothetical protein
MPTSSREANFCIGRKDLAIITVVLNDLRGIQQTAISLNRAFLRIQKKSSISIEWIIKDGNSTELVNIKSLAISPALARITKLYTNNDNGIYDAMEQALDLANSTWITFLNAGDLCEEPGYSNLILNIANPALSKNVIFYGKSKWNNDKALGLTKLFGDKVVPLLGRLPNHQAMIIPARLQKEIGFDRRLPISADKDFKIRALRTGVPWIPHDEICISSEPNGASFKINTMRKLSERSFETYLLMKKNYGILWGLIYSLIFFAWNSRKLIKKFRPS